MDFAAPLGVAFAIGVQRRSGRHVQQRDVRVSEPGDLYVDMTKNSAGAEQNQWHAAAVALYADGELPKPMVEAATVCRPEGGVGHPAVSCG